MIRNCVHTRCGAACKRDATAVNNEMMKTDNRLTWCLKTAARLRAVHASLSDLAIDARDGYLKDEIEYALDDAAGIPGESRHSLLKALEDHFPVYGIDDSSAAAEPNSVSKPDHVSKPNDADSCLEYLTKNIDSLTEQQRKILSSLVKDVAPRPEPVAAQLPAVRGLVLPEGAAEMDDFQKALQGMCAELSMQGEGDNTPRLNRLIKMVGMLTGAYRDLYRFVWPFWKEMAGREMQSQFHPTFPSGLQDAIGAYLTGGDINSRDFYSEIDKTKKMLISLLFGLRKGAEEFGKAQERRYSCDAILDSVALEESASDVARIKERERKCWDKYSQMTKHLTTASVMDDILKHVADATFNRMKLN